ncbi:MAG: 2-C-methyl-D-erythritol 4-phosphate cytidylyltransferase [Candidatus Nanopelagicaceae bacterium]
MPQLSVFLIIDNPLAKKLLNGVSLHQLALDEANSFCERNNAKLIEVTQSNLLGAIKESGAEIVVIHDALRPLVSAVQFQRTFDALADSDAVRPTMAFTETIKALDEQGRLDQTIDREKVRRLSSPEIIKVSAIDFGGATNYWSVPLKAGAKLAEVSADPESVRINSESELAVMNAFLALRK